MAENGDVNGPLMVENCSITMLAYQRVYSMIDWYWCVYDIYIYISNWYDIEYMWKLVYMIVCYTDMCITYNYIYIIIDSSSEAEHKICYSWIHGYDIWEYVL